MNKISNWTEYYNITSKNPPSKILVKAVTYLNSTGLTTGKVLELGAGTPRDSLFLLENGFSVVAVDKEIDAKDLFQELIVEYSDKLKFVHSTFRDFDFTSNSYDIVSAQRALPFISNKLALSKCIDNIKSSLTKNGVFVGHFFGPNDTWNIEGKEMSFVNEIEIKEMFRDFKVIDFIEREEDSQTANGTPHHWHIYSVIFQK